MQRRHRLWHRRLWQGLAVLLPLLLALALVLRLTAPADAPPVLLQGPVR
jgi:hypothetical protein